MENILKKYNKKKIIKIIIVGIGAGIISGLFSSGGGLIFVLAFSNFLGLEEKRARATTIFCMLPIVIVTGVLYNLNIDINYNVAIKCAIGGVIGSVIGSFILSKLSDKYLNLSFIIFLVYCIIRMVLN